MKLFRWLILFVLALWLGVMPQSAFGASSLRVSGNGRYLEDVQGQPFFWLGDTAWRMIQRLSRENFDTYLSDRANRGFTVIQTAAFSITDDMGLGGEEDYYGNKPFSVDGDLTSHNEAYFQNVDYFIDATASQGLQVNFLPMILGGVHTADWLSDASEAYSYGEWLGERYRDKTNIIWCLGGDIEADMPNSNYVTYWREMARGIAIGVNDGVNPDYSKVLMTYHPSTRSSIWFHGDQWEDANGIQTYDTPTNIYPRVSGDYGLSPTKPTFLLEPEYEYNDQPDWKYTTPVFNRRQAYWSYLAGAAGFTFGNGPIFRARTIAPTWQDALSWDGSLYMTQYKNIISSVDWWKNVPDQTIVTSGVGAGDLLIAAGKSSDGDYLLAYVPVQADQGDPVNPRSVTINMAKITADSTCHAKWVYPADSTEVIIGTYPNTGTREFITPADWEDALLVVTAGQTSVPSAPSGLAVH